MTQTIRPTILPPSEEGEPFGLYVCALGFEARSICGARRGRGRIDRGLAIGFTVQQVLNYESNREFFAEAGFTVRELTDGEFAQWAVSEFIELLDECVKSRHPRIGIDISSFSRYRLAVLVHALRRHTLAVPLDVEFQYTLAEYSPPPSVEGPNLHVGPVFSPFSGWTADPDEAVVAIVGLGYEHDRAVGAVEHVQASETWVFRPVSPIATYAGPLEAANSLLTRDLPLSAQVNYPVLDPFYTFALLESLVSRALLRSGCVIFPFGPKAFAAVSMLVASVHPDAAVWRVSPGLNALPVDRKGSQHVCRIRAAFDPIHVIDWEREAMATVAWHG